MQGTPVPSGTSARPPSRRALALLCVAVPVAAALAGVLIGLTGGTTAANAAGPTTERLADAAGTTATQAAAPLPAGLDVSWSGVIAVFVILGCALAALAWVARRGVRVKRGNGTLHLVDTLALGPRRLLHVVRVNERLYLVGNSEKGVQYLATLPDAALDRTLGDEPAAEVAGDAEPEFAGMLSRAGARG